MLRDTGVSRRGLTGIVGRRLTAGRQARDGIPQTYLPTRPAEGSQRRDVSQPGGDR
jgi:hypothetical protein